MTPMQWIILLSQAADAYARVQAALDNEEIPLDDPDVNEAMKLVHQRHARLGQSFEEKMLRLREEKQSDG